MTLSRRHFLQTSLADNAVGMGEAAGVTAALAALSKRLPHEVAWSEAHAKLKEMGQRV